MKRRFLILVLAAVALPAFAQTGQDDRVGEMSTIKLHVGKAVLTTEVAATGPQQERGLMWRSSLPDNDGMLFLLPAPEIATFWMKNTLIPLSIAYIDANGVILEIHDMRAGDPNLQDNDLPRYKSDSDHVCYALETNLHWFALNGVKAGDKLDPAPASLRQPVH